MIDFIAAIENESARFSHLIQNTDATAAVPSCPGWSVADLSWHLLEVQYFWASILTGPLTSPESVVDLERPDSAELPERFDRQAEALIAALRAHHPDEECWSWHHLGHRVGWVARRQAHEALIHRVDAELAAGGPFAVDAELAADGIDEVLHFFLDSAHIPDWGSFDPDGTTAALRIDTGASWGMRLGRFTGTSPNTGNTYDDPSVLLAAAPDPTATISGVAADLDLWLWGRGSLKTLRIEGDPAIAAGIRAAATAATQ